MEPEPAQEQLHEDVELPTEPVASEQPKFEKFTIAHPNFKKFMKRYGRTKIKTMSTQIFTRDFEELLEAEKRLIEDF